MKNIKAENRTVGSLVEDFDLYARDRIKVDGQRVKRYVEAAKAGAKLPPIIILPDGRILDGFHRRRAFTIAFGESYKARCEVWTGDLNEGWIHAQAINDRHGIQLTPGDRVRSIIVAEALGIDLSELATAFSTTTEALTALLENRTATSAATNGAIPVKRPLRHLAGTKLTARDEEVNRKSSGMMPSFYANQLIDLLSGDRTLNVGDRAFLDRLIVLGDLIESKVRALK